MWRGRSSAADEMNDLEHVASAEQRRRMVGASDDLAIALDGNGPRRESEKLDECANGRAFGDFAPGSVDLDLDGTHDAREGIAALRLAQTREGGG